MDQKQLKVLSTLFVLSIATFMMTGCSTPPIGTVGYDTNHSRAWNITRQFMPAMRVTRDREAPPEVSNLDPWGTVAINEMMSSRSMNTRWFGTALMAIDIVGSFENPENFGTVLGYVPLSEAKTPEEAIEVYARQMHEVFSQAIKDAYPSFKIERESETTQEKPLRPHWKSVVVVDEKIGCPRSVDKAWNKRPCALILRPEKLDESTHPENLPEFLFGAGKVGWKMAIRVGSTTIEPNRSLKNKINPTKLMLATSKYLPSSMYVWHRPKKGGYAFVVEKEKINLFVKPKMENK